MMYTENISILTIDDNDSIRLSIVSYLEDLDYTVYTAVDGEDGIRIIEDKNPDIILTDIHMPGVSGIDVLHYVQKEHAETPVIVISGAGEIEFVIKALRAGAWDYITKPIEDLTFLSYSIDAVLKRVALIRDNREKSLEIEEKNNQLRQTIEILQNTQKELVEAEKMASLGYMVTGVAHEINTPLGISLTSVSYLNDESKNIIDLNSQGEMKLSDFNKYTETVTDITKLVRRSLETINHLISSFKELSVDKQQDEQCKFSINDQIRGSVSMVLSNFPEKDILLSMSGDPLLLDSYPEAISRIFRKLTENAIIHGFKDMDKGVININISTQLDRVVIEFKNNGHKIRNGIVERIFDPFVTENKKYGVGLGLCIAYNLVAFKLDGDILCNNLDEGVRFSISFPK